MKLWREIILALAGLLIIGFFDFVWFKWIAKEFYIKNIGDIMRHRDINFIALALVYVVLIVGLVALALLPALEKNRASMALLFGALYGLSVYGVYNLTNVAIIRGYSSAVAMADMAWGTALMAITVLLLFLLNKAF